MSITDLRRAPTALENITRDLPPTGHMWYYEEARGLVVVTNDGKQGVIPWQRVRAALRRRDKPKGKGQGR